jgi:geranylgeranyl pyrophosphate synthase
MKLKTGALMGFAALLGAAITGLPKSLLPIFEHFGCNLGMALQMFDDLGNVIGRCEPAKRFEDLTLGRPSWIWASAAAIGTATEYRKFVAATAHLPDSTEFENWAARHDLVNLTRKSARAHLDFSFDSFEGRLNIAKVNWSRGAFDELRALGEEIAVAYG